MVCFGVAIDHFNRDMDGGRSHSGTVQAVARRGHGARRAARPLYGSLLAVPRNRDNVRRSTGRLHSRPVGAGLALEQLPHPRHYWYGLLWIDESGRDRLKRNKRRRGAAHAGRGLNRTTRTPLARCRTSTAERDRSVLYRCCVDDPETGIIPS